MLNGLRIIGYLGMRTFYGAALHKNEMNCSFIKVKSDTTQFYGIKQHDYVENTKREHSL